MLTFDAGVRNSVRIMPIGNDGLVSASDATSWRADATLLQVILRRFWFQLRSSTNVFGDSGKFVTIN
jgi:hypothetical protein